MLVANSQDKNDFILIDMIIIVNLPVSSLKISIANFNWSLIYMSKIMNGIYTEVLAQYIYVKNDIVLISMITPDLNSNCPR